MMSLNSTDKYTFVTYTTIQEAIESVRLPEQIIIEAIALGQIVAIHLPNGRIFVRLNDVRSAFEV